jgi:hypothetical protein
VATGKFLVYHFRLGETKIDVEVLKKWKNFSREKFGMKINEEENFARIIFKGLSKFQSFFTNSPSPFLALFNCERENSFES